MRQRNRPRHFGTPANPNAKYHTYCKDCGEILVRMPRRGPLINSFLAHLIVDRVQGKWQVNGWTESCPKFH